MAKQVINVGTSANDGTGDPNRTAFQKINANFTELYDGEGAGTLQQVTDNGKRTTNEIISTTSSLVRGSLAKISILTVPSQDPAKI
jgi:hypothetical protein